MGGVPRAQLRCATSRDDDFIFGVLDEAIGPYLREVGAWDELEQRRIVAYLLETADVYVVEVNEADAGYLAVWRSRDEIYVASVALAERWQRQGLGTALLGDLILEAQERGVPLRLNVMSNNPAREFYARLGFAVTRADGRKLDMERRT